MMLGALTAGSLGGLRLNATPSIPAGIYKIKPDHVIGRGDVVAACPPRTEFIRAMHEAGYIKSGWCPGGYASLFKPVAAVPGDLVSFSPAGASVNGILLPNTQPASSDAGGNHLLHPPFVAHYVRAGELWLLSSFHEASIDSRYFGLLSTITVRHALSSRFIWRGL